MVQYQKLFNKKYFLKYPFGVCGFGRKLSWLLDWIILTRTEGLQSLPDLAMVFDAIDLNVQFYTFSTSPQR